MCEMQLRRTPSLLRGLGIRSHDDSVHGDHCPIHHRFSRYRWPGVTQPHRRFIRIRPLNFPLAWLLHSARSFLRHYPSLSTSRLPVRQRGMRDSPGYWTGSSFASLLTSGFRVALKPSQHSIPMGTRTMLREIVQWVQALSQLHARIAPRFARPEPRGRALSYLQGRLEFRRAQKWVAIGRTGPRSHSLRDATPAL